ncbi:TetR/AcrR family transcriptional regulator [Novosphingobium sp. G106]|uniref:TetR/AcrR family transcriptional regulator n=1 Tax=Novosphingobium sp. G106 TaxID=2849500 RepID=UPI001C2D5F36|nr:TetR/AcrR family transcriptional regulator [Novosphingobium sp. G106]MBV1686688.1 TetR/AcrR family transcriptional regulator [Novosphingobium sp. G106]
MARPSSKSKEVAREAAGRRGRPTAERVAAIDSAIKATALDLFVELGFEAASMDAIAVAAKVSKGTLYARYESKEPLFRAILEEQLEEWSERSSQNNHLLPDDLEGRLRHYARSMVRAYNWPEFQRIATLVETSAQTFPDLVREWNDQVMQRGVDWLTYDMARTGGTGPDWAFFANLFISAVSGWHRVETSRRVVPDEEVLAFADRVIDVMLVSIAHAQATTAPDARAITD